MDVEIQVYRVLGSFPILAVWIAGGMICYKQTRLLPRRRTLTAAAIAIAAAAHIFLPFVTTFIFNRLFQDIQSIPIRNSIDAFLFAIPQAVVWGLLLWVLFGPADDPVPRVSAGRNEPHSDG